MKIPLPMNPRSVAALLARMDPAASLNRPPTSERAFYQPRTGDISIPENYLVGGRDLQFLRDRTGLPLELDDAAEQNFIGKASPTLADLIAFFQAGAPGKAKVEYEKALSRLEKTSDHSAELRSRLQEKIRRSKEALAHDHQQTAANLIEAGYVDDAQQYIGLALELTADPLLKSELNRQLQDLDTYLAEEFPRNRPPVEMAAEETEAVEERVPPIFEVQEDEYFGALIGTLPEEVQDAYLSYGNPFQKGYLALNQGDFDLAAENLNRAMQAHPDPQSYIPLELATALFNLGRNDEARRLVESFLKYHPDALPGYQLLCEIFWETKSLDQVEALLNSLPRELAESGAAYLLRGNHLYHSQFDSEN